MTLAELIHKALINPQYRLALETGTLNTENLNLSPRELAAAVEVLGDTQRTGRVRQESLLAAMIEPLKGWGS